MYGKNELIYLGLGNQIQLYLPQHKVDNIDNVKVRRVNDSFICTGDWTILPNNHATFTFKTGGLLGCYYFVD